MKERYIVSIGIILAICISAGLGAVFTFTDIYDEVKKSIVEIICLSCLKLTPKTSMEFTFKTANGQNHPDFVLENLTKGPVFLHYSEDDCAACDIMFPVIKQFFNIEFPKETSYHTITAFRNQTVPYIYIYLDDKNTPSQWLDSFDIYDKDLIKGLPIFTVVTLGYEHSGDIKPYYTTLYGAFKDNDEQRLQLLTELMDESFDLYNENKEGFEPHH
jgi:thiol-disulfide isomerase/thioredoxin